MSGRRLLAEALRAALPAWQIVSDPRQLDAVRKPAAAVLWTSKRTKAPALGLDWFADEVELWALTAIDKPADIEDDLDARLLDVMAALEPLDTFAWTTAERGALADTFDGYKLTVTCIVQITPEPEEEEEGP